MAHPALLSPAVATLLSNTFLSNTSAEEAGRIAGKLMGSGMLAIALIAGIVVAIKSAGKPEVNGKGAYALVFAFVTWLIALSFGTFDAAKNRVAAVLGSLSLFTFAIIAVVLATVALLEMANNQRQQKKGQAIWALVLAAISGLAVGVGFMKGLMTRSNAEKELVVSKSSNGEVREYPELNYTFKVPDEPWQELNAKKLNKQASFAVRRADPEVYLIVIAEKGGEDMTSEALDEISQANTEKVAKKSTVSWEKAHKIHGLDGYAHRIDATVDKQEFTYVVWALAHQGYLYQVVAWGNSRDADQVESHAMKAFKNFNVIKADESPPL
jgi:Ca2+/Na+ antiporter